MFVLSDETTEEDEDFINRKIDLLLSKMMHDRSLINEKTFSSSFYDILIAHLHINLSPDSKKLILEKYKQLYKHLGK